MTLAEPPRWSADEIDGRIDQAVALFREKRMLEPLELYTRAFDDGRLACDELLALTEDLTRIEERAVAALGTRRRQEVVRYLAGPPVSDDDLRVIASATLAPGRLRADPELARQVVRSVLLGLDRGRFPWIGEDRRPTASERGAATVATAALIAARRVMTGRANESKTTQEEAVAIRLRAAGLEEAAGQGSVATLAQAPRAGRFIGREVLFGNRKADLMVGLWDGRCMAIECKVSNSATNSIKRVRDASEKAERWIGQFGTLGVVPAAVLSGVFKRETLLDAQRVGLTLFWAHDLEGLVAFVRATAGDGDRLFPSGPHAAR